MIAQRASFFSCYDKRATRPYDNVLIASFRAFCIGLCYDLSCGYPAFVCGCWRFEGRAVLSKTVSILLIIDTIVDNRRNPCRLHP